MIVGNGMMAHAFSFYDESPEVLIFASGVSNARERDKAVFGKEEALLREHLTINRGTVFIYFSTCSLYDPALQGSEYSNHKRHMEGLVRSKATNYLIFRLPQVVGRTKSPTLVNYLYDMVSSGHQFEVGIKDYRYLIDCEDVFKICSHIIERRLFLNNTVNVAPLVKISVSGIVETIEQILDKKGNYVLVDKGSESVIDLQVVMPIIEELGLVFNKQYPERVIRKYCELT